MRNPVHRKTMSALDRWELNYRKRKLPKFNPHPVPEWVKNSRLPKPEWMTNPPKPLLPYPNPDAYCSYVGCKDHIRENDFFGFLDRHGLQPKIVCLLCYDSIVAEKTKKQQEAWDYLIAHRN